MIAPRSTKEWATLAFVPMLMVGLIVGVLTFIGSYQANQYQTAVNTLTRQHDAIICILEILPADRTTEKILQCAGNPPHINPTP